MEDRITRARQLISEIHHAAISTVNADGSPHNSPVFTAFDHQLHAYWSSHPESQHSLNIARSGQAFIALFDSRVGHGGLYIEAKVQPLESSQDLERAYSILEELKKQLGSSLGPASRYSGSGPQRFYQATPNRLWINCSDRDAAGLILRDRRHEVSLAQLTGQKDL